MSWPRSSGAARSLWRKSPDATREQNLMTDSETSGRPQPAMTGTELARTTTIKKPNVFQQDSRRQRGAEPQPRARV